MTRTTKRLNISFYLLTPTAKTQSMVYVSLGRNYDRLRFSTGESFYTAYCNHRGQKNGKDLLKKNSAFFLEYKSKLESIRLMLMHIDNDLSKTREEYGLINIKDKYLVQAGIKPLPPALTFEGAWIQFCATSRSKWVNATEQHFNAVYRHVCAYEKLKKISIQLTDLNMDLWNDFRDNYFVDVKKFSNNSINKNLKKLRQFFHFLNNNELAVIKNVLAMTYLEEIDPFKIALKIKEVEVLAGLDLRNDLRLDKVRDLFLLEILTGQRFSDLPAILNKENISDTAITIYQQKTNERVVIPLHPKLESHLKDIVRKYPTGLPILSNQKFNDYLKELCKEKAKFDRRHSWITLTGKKKIQRSAHRYDLIRSHTGRRTFCTLALAAGIHAETIMKVTGHQDYDQFRDYVKVDDADVNEAFENKFMKNEK